MKTIITVQHPQSVHHTNGMIGSWTDWDITDQGLRQAEAIGRRLASELTNIHCALYTSDLLRARHTAEILSGHLHIPPQTSAALRERNLGQAVGKSVQWYRENSREERSVDDRCFPDAESQRDVWNRLAPFLETVLTVQADTVLLVSHGDALSVFNSLWLELPPESLRHCRLSGLAGGVSFLYELPDGGRTIRRLSDMSYCQI
jgi:broad specificity phosphatase PhoE